MNTSSSSYHQPVMLAEMLAAMELQPAGCYVDLTFGGGGHARAILEQLGPQGKLIAFDQDPDALQQAEELDDPRLHFVQANFRHFARFLHYLGIGKVEGILADLGVSSYQLDTASRGFAIRLEGPLDMRMGQGGTSAATLLHTLSLLELTKIFKEYGELPNSYALARHLVGVRSATPITTMEALRKAVVPCLPAYHTYKYYARLCQALRMAVNDELGALGDMLVQVPSCLQLGGRLTVLAYHSLEDRPVKRFMRTGNLAGVPKKDPFGELERPLVPLYRKAQQASNTEVAANRRARSVRLRCAVRQ